VKHYRPDKCTLAAMASAAQQQRALAAGASRCSPSLAYISVDSDGT